MSTAHRGRRLDQVALGLALGWVADLALGDGFREPRVGDGGELVGWKGGGVDKRRVLARKLPEHLQQLGVARPPP